MTDDFENLNHQFKEIQPPKPDAEKKKLAIAKALAAYEQKNKHAPQGSTQSHRPISTAWADFIDFVRESVMTKTHLVAGTALAAVLVLATSTLYYSPVMKPGTSSAPVQTAQYDAFATPQSTAPEKDKAVAAMAQPVAPTSVYIAEKEMRADVAQDQLALNSAGNASPMPMESSMARAEMKYAPSSAPIAGFVQVEPTRQYYQDQGRDRFEQIKVNPIRITKEDPVSTFSIDVDTSSYSFVRASLNENTLPQKDAVRIEELVNYFPYNYEAPKDKAEPFKANVSVYPTPWNAGTKIMHIGIKGYELPQKDKPHSNLVFLIDTSGSMNAPNKLPLVQNALKMLLDTLKEDDTVGIVTYAGSAGIALEPTRAKDKLKITQVIDNLGAGGSTAGAEGIRLAYQLAEKNMEKGAVNRVVLATDGDFNVGITSQDELKSFVERERNSGVFLSVLGFGMGNYNDAMMQALAQNGNGNAAYIDNINEARKALVEEAGSTLFTIAKDVKIQVEFNPAQVKEYRLIGYENRLLNREDFNNDKVDAGDIGSGHAVTALYEITPVGSNANLNDNLRYSESARPVQPANNSGEYAFVKIRYKLPDNDTSKLITTPVDSKVEVRTSAEASREALFATSVAAFGQILRGDPFTKNYSYDDVIALAEADKGSDQFGYRAEFINLVRLARNAPSLPVQK